MKYFFLGFVDCKQNNTIHKKHKLIYKYIKQKRMKSTGKFVPNAF